MDAKDCPLCGTAMRLHRREQPVRVPGASTPKISRITEWRCPDCDYFEDAEES